MHVVCPGFPGGEARLETEVTANVALCPASMHFVGCCDDVVDGWNILQIWVGQIKLDFLIIFFNAQSA